MSIIAIIAPNISTIQHKRNFRFGIMFNGLSSSRILDTEKFDISSNLILNGDITDVTFTLINVSQTTKCAYISVVLPKEVKGSFTIDVTGNIVVDGVAHEITGPSKTIKYNTITKVRMMMG